MPNSASARLTCDQLELRHTSHALIAIMRYRTVQTGPKIQLGGVHSGRRNCVYHVFTDELVKSAPIAAAVKHTTTKGTRDIHDPRSNIARLFRFAPVAR